jgi:hypothetical protein
LTVVAAVERDLKLLRKRAPVLAVSPLAAAALVLAAQLDDSRGSATSKAMCAKGLAELLRELRELAPPLVEGDSIDDLASRRSSRRSA